MRSESEEARSESLVKSPNTLRGKYLEGTIEEAGVHPLGCIGDGLIVDSRRDDVEGSHENGDDDTASKTCEEGSAYGRHWWSMGKDVRCLELKTQNNRAFL